MSRFSACGFSCNARPPCSRSAGSIRRASLRASSRVRGLATWLSWLPFYRKATWRGAPPRYRRAGPVAKMRPRGGQEAAKTATFSHLFLNTFLDRSFIDFPSNLAPFWPPKSKKIGEKSMSRWLPIITSFFDRFLIDFCFQLRPPDSSKPWFFP